MLKKPKITTFRLTPANKKSCNSFLGIQEPWKLVLKLASRMLATSSRYHMDGICRFISYHEFVPNNHLQMTSTINKSKKLHEVC